METKPPSVLTALAVTSRRVASALIAGVWRRIPLEEVDSRLSRLPAREQVVIVGATLAALLAAAILAAQFGWIAMLGFWLGVIVIVN